MYHVSICNLHTSTITWMVHASFDLPFAVTLVRVELPREGRRSVNLNGTERDGIQFIYTIRAHTFAVCISSATGGKTSRTSNLFVPGIDSYRRNRTGTGKKLVVGHAICTVVLISNVIDLIRPSAKRSLASNLIRGKGGRWGKTKPVGLLPIIDNIRLPIISQWKDYYGRR